MLFCCSCCSNFSFWELFRLVPMYVPLKYYHPFLCIYLFVYLLTPFLLFGIGNLLNVPTLPGNVPDSHFKNRTEAQNSLVTCPRSPRGKRVELILKPRNSDAQVPKFLAQHCLLHKITRARERPGPKKGELYH